MNLRFLRTFVAIADNAGVARAAARLNLTQSAASRQIQTLENELGLRLFARIGRSVRLTREGEDLLVRSRRLLADAAALGERASALKSGEVGVLRLGATPQVIETLLAEFLPRYRKRHTGVEVHLVEDGGARLPGRLERGDIDVAIMPAGDDRFRGRLLYPMHVLAVLPQRHRLSRSAVLDVTELADEPLLRLTPGFASHGWFEAACQRCACPPARAARKRRPADADRIGPSRPRHCGGSFSGADSSVPAFAWRWWCIAACRSANGRSQPGSRSDSCRPMRCNSSKKWPRTAGAIIPAAPMFAARRRCRSHQMAR